MSIPKTGNINLRAIRQDCGLSANGPQKVIELSDRAGTTNWTSSGFSMPSTIKLNDLRGKTIARPTSHTEFPISSHNNTNPGAACRVNHAEANIYSQLPSVSAGLGLSPANNYANGLRCHCQGFSGYMVDSFAGYIFAGKIEEAGNYDHRCYFGSKTGSSVYLTIETIGWSSGFFQGTPKYFWEVRGGFNNMRSDSQFGDSQFAADLRYPFMTINVNAWAPGYIDHTSQVHIERMGIVKL